MSLGRAIAAELHKTATLPAARVAVAIAALGSLGITVLNATGIRAALDSGRLDDVGYTSPVEAAFSASPLGTVGAVILGVIAIGSEYSANSSDAGGGRQISSTLTVLPRRLRLLVAKAAAIVLLLAGTAAVTLPACLAVSHLIIGTSSGEGWAELAIRCAGAALYWTLTALIALAIAVLARDGTIPLIVLIANSSLVSVSILLSNLTPLAYYLPDLAGMRLFARDAWAMTADALDPLTGGLVMAAWAFGLLAVAAVAFERRDA